MARLSRELPKLAERHPSVGDVRGLGCFWALELVRNRETKEPLVPFNAAGEALQPIAKLSKARLPREAVAQSCWWIRQSRWRSRDVAARPDAAVDRPFEGACQGVQ